MTDTSLREQPYSELTLIEDEVRAVFDEHMFTSKRATLVSKIADYVLAKIGQVSATQTIAALEGLRMEREHDFDDNDEVYFETGFNTAVDKFNAKIDAAIAQAKEGK